MPCVNNVVANLVYHVIYTARQRKFSGYYVKCFLVPEHKMTVSGSGEFVICDPQSEDEVLYRGSVEKSRRLLRKVEAELKIFTGGATIHCIHVVDNKGDGNAANVTVASGGLGAKNVILKFESHRNSGIHSNVTISGH
ncbi:hypothetical protein PR048_015236 [Dryococelus australis]|uniref:Uncharacterized protein n=1 Tax=Dryococelus australis TaxID=614101 RepID=A0ABQ9HGD5_9NEOP|nr:hypothetical protein PR048_015236 [Dryococelus australis]